jgi:Cu/Ag efflux protein CusF
MKTSTIVHSLVTVGLGLALLALTGVTNAQTETAQTHSGTIRAIKADDRLVTVDGANVALTFLVPAAAEIIVKDKPKGDLADLKVGDTVEVKYTREPAGYTAQKIAVIGLK